jgi:hypothetical protein
MLKLEEILFWFHRSNNVIIDDVKVVDNGVTDRPYYNIRRFLRFAKFVSFEFPTKTLKLILTKKKEEFGTKVYEVIDKPDE